MAAPGTPATPAVYCGPGNTNLHALGLSAKHTYFGGRLFLSLIQRLNAVISLTSLPGTGVQSRGIGTWLRAVDRIGQESAFGAVFSGQIGDVANAVVIKMNKDTTKSAALRLEYAVQTYLNSLRAYCPNFVLALGAFACTQLDDTARRVAAPLCSGTGEVVDYIIIERIESVPSPVPGAPGDSWTLAQYLALGPVDMDVVHSTFVQVMLALHFAQSMLQFTHYDLHLNNVMLQGLHQLRDVAFMPTGRAVITYPMIPTPWTVRAEYIAVIIDFGASRVTAPDSGHNVGGVWAPMIGMTPAFTAAYDPYMFLGALNNSLSQRGAQDYAPLAAWAQSQRRYNAAVRPDIYLGLDPLNNPDRARGLSASSMLDQAVRLVPGLVGVLTHSDPADLRLPMDLSNLAAAYDCVREPRFKPFF